MNDEGQDFDLLDLHNFYIFFEDICTRKYANKTSTEKMNSPSDRNISILKICREALTYKLSNIGIKGLFFECIQNIYSNYTIRQPSTAKLELNRDTLCSSCLKYSLTTCQLNLTKNHGDRQCLILMVSESPFALCR